MKKILVATDFSERSDRALRRAVLLARRVGAELGLVHVVDDDQPPYIVGTERKDAEKLLAQMAATLREVDGVECRTQVVLASPFIGIASAVDSLAPDLLVIGPHRRQVLKDVFIGTTAERTIRSVSCPVLMVNAPPAGPYRHVLLTTDLSEGSCNALRRLPALGGGALSRHSLLYVFDTAGLNLTFSHSLPTDAQDRYRLEAERDASRELAQFAATAGLGDLRHLARRKSTAVPHEILKAAEAEHADLVVISTHGRSGLAKMLLGSVTEQVLRDAPVDVLALPPLPETV
ncbi:universal stress protein [Celeribacter indicus]|uniref:UspA domain-containing protein n=1 Tax=Celeribacter indicus TaxID=1208324 RepID=A0A0B5E2S8_9RHOB|nr:universal stress protein [Celeribacter indicus]AJE46752.1 UspA domain-containing protein [Celeribacter indicus]SDX05578.1 Nucleotide-binding universal stress protein, UspA family [Celeribacter indicus]